MAEQNSRAVLASGGTAPRPPRSHPSTRRSDQRAPRRRPRCFVVRLPDAEPIEWNPPEPTAAMGYDIAYWGRVIEVTGRLLQDPDLTFYLTSSGARVPAVGSRVVVIGMNAPSWKEAARCAHRVRATFQAGGRWPKLAGSLRGPLVPILTTLGLRGRVCASDLQALLRRISAGARDGRGAHPTFAVPPGYQSAAQPSLKPMAERPIALSFAGSIKHWEGWWGNFTAKMGAPKVRSRRGMLRAVERLRRSHPDLPIRRPHIRQLRRLQPGHRLLR